MSAARVRVVLLLLLLGGAAAAHFGPRPWPHADTIDALFFGVILLDWTWLRLIQPAVSRRAPPASGG